MNLFTFSCAAQGAQSSVLNYSRFLSREYQQVVTGQQLFARDSAALWGRHTEFPVKIILFN